MNEIAGAATRTADDRHQDAVICGRLPELAEGPLAVMIVRWANEREMLTSGGFVVSGNALMKMLSERESASGGRLARVGEDGPWCLTFQAALENGEKITVREVVATFSAEEHFTSLPDGTSVLQGDEPIAIFRKDTALPVADGVFSAGLLADMVRDRAASGEGGLCFIFDHLAQNFSDLCKQPPRTLREVLQTHRRNLASSTPGFLLPQAS